LLLDPNYVPLGAPIYFDKADRSKSWVCGLRRILAGISGPNRFDTFWGAGPDAVATAGGMSANGEALILVPKGAAARALPQH
jgi:membrane-bound lytic murein transglycosylase A